MDPEKPAPSKSGAEVNTASEFPGKRDFIDQAGGRMKSHVQLVEN